MNRTKSIYNKVFKALAKETTKISQKAYDVLNREGIAGIIECDGVFWFEYYSYGNSCTEDIYSYLKRFIKRKFELDYLYDVA